MFLELWHEALDSFRVATGPLGTSCLASGKSPCELRGVRRFALEALQGNWASSRKEGVFPWGCSRCSGKFGFLSSCVGDLRAPFLWPMGNQASFQLAGAH